MPFPFFFFPNRAETVVARVGAENRDQVLATTILAYALSTIMTGAVFLALGYFKVQFYFTILFSLTARVHRHFPCRNNFSHASCLIIVHAPPISFLAGFPHRLLPSPHSGWMHRRCGLVPDHHWCRSLFKNDNILDLLTRHSQVPVLGSSHLCSVVKRVWLGVAAASASAQDSPPFLGPRVLHGCPRPVLLDRLLGWIRL